MVDGFEGNEATDAGNRLEEAVLLWALDQLKVHSSEPNVSLVHDQHEWMTANLDMRAITRNGARIIIEAKTGGITSPLQHDKWGDAFTDELPETYKIQVHHQMAVAGEEYRETMIAALLGGRGFVPFIVKRDDELIAALIERERAFWFNCVVGGLEPDSSPSMDVVNRIRRETGKEVPVRVDLVREYVLRKANEKYAKEASDRAKADLIASLRDAEVGRYGVGEKEIVTYFQQTRKAHEVKESTFRKISVKGGAKEVGDE